MFTSRSRHALRPSLIRLSRDPSRGLTQSLLVAHVGEARVLHHLGVDAIVVCPRLEYDPREHHRLARLRLGQTSERNSELAVEIIAGALSVFERAMLAPDLTRLLGQAALCLHILLGDRQNISIDVLHVNPPLVCLHS